MIDVQKVRKEIQNIVITKAHISSSLFHPNMSCKCGKNKHIESQEIGYLTFPFLYIFYGKKERNKKKETKNVSPIKL